MCLFGSSGGLLSGNLALAFYNVGTIWAHEIDTFRSWKLRAAQEAIIRRLRELSPLGLRIFQPAAVRRARRVP
jgi:hypothetical protein